MKAYKFGDDEARAQRANGFTESADWASQMELEPWGLAPVLEVEDWAGVVGVRDGAPELDMLAIDLAELDLDPELLGAFDWRRGL